MYQFPLKDRILIPNAGWNAKRRDARRGWFLHHAQDYRANFVPVYMAFDGAIHVRWERQGGLWIIMDGDRHRLELAHCSRYYKIGTLKKGELVGKTGNTGYLTSGPHLHLQAIDKLTGQRVDPESLPWSNSKDMIIKSSTNEISYLSTAGVRHYIAANMYHEFFDGVDGSEAQFDPNYYNYPVGKPFDRDQI